ncbi:Thiamine-binding periplasmic protein precursor [Actinomyces bovis]|uniref:Thiamine-binding periplasmic protein n=1 Tax=Actinomyces bovis TaxID=1658 RepID=A0ABY1VQW1_9ACTO|nr:thiamine ABC transporter substrate-binding protein [Actinomyces bovis]SPT55056.1 Thiamine-binding periplasmic protein precursor [Actinomyces bovis]VEG56226.1 Thiamine-binding periplasmic protein precursor [Actinomyces israelii]
MSNPQPTRRVLLASAGLTALGATLAACGSSSKTNSTATDGASAASPSAGGKKVTVLTHDSFNVPDDLKTAFEDSSGYTLELIPSGDAGELTNKLVLTKDAPLGDAVFGIDNTFASRALSEQVIDDTLSLTLPTGADQYLVDGHKGLVPIDFGEVCINVDTKWFADKGLTPPASFEDLTKPEYQGLFVAINPSTSSPGLAFLVATVGHFGEEGFAQYWKDLKANGMKIAEGWTAAYETDFSAGEGKGAYPIVVSYASSPAATISEDGTTTTQALLSTSTRQVEYAGVLTKAANPEGAKAFIEWMLSAELQSSIPDHMYMYPVNPEATLPEKLSKFGKTSDAPIVVAPADIASKRESWLTTWTETVGA